MENNYYMIPIALSDDIYIKNKKNKSLRDLLKESYPCLIKLESERVGLIYSSGFDVAEKQRKNRVNTDKMYEKYNIPYYLLAYGNDDCAEEIISSYKIVPKYSSALGIRKVSKEKTMEYYYNNNYQEKVCNYLNIINNKNNNIFYNLSDIDFDNFEGYIDGKIGDQEIKGCFEGQIKIKKLTLKNK